MLIKVSKNLRNKHEMLILCLYTYIIKTSEPELKNTSIFFVKQILSIFFNFMLLFDVFWVLILFGLQKMLMLLFYFHLADNFRESYNNSDLLGCFQYTLSQDLFVHRSSSNMCILHCSFKKQPLAIWKADEKKCFCDRFQER